MEGTSPNDGPLNDFRLSNERLQCLFLGLDWNKAAASRILHENEQKYKLLLNYLVNVKAIFRGSTELTGKFSWGELIPDVSSMPTYMSYMRPTQSKSPFPLRHGLRFPAPLRLWAVATVTMVRHDNLCS